LLVKLHYVDKLETVKAWFAEYGIWIVAIAGFSPMPYKIFLMILPATGIRALFVFLSIFLSVISSSA
jgi:membrane protein YqaA with SNARE-associated domain